MGTNSSKYDVDKEYSKLTVKELEKIIKHFESACEKHPEVKLFNEHLQFTKMKLAEKIGKRKV